MESLVYSVVRRVRSSSSRRESGSNQDGNSHEREQAGYGMVNLESYLQ